MKWFNTLSHNRWLEQETDRIFDFGKNSVVPTGFGWLGNKGQIKEEMGTHLWITARMLHVYSVEPSLIIMISRAVQVCVIKDSIQVRKSSPALYNGIITLSLLVLFIINYRRPLKLS